MMKTWIGIALVGLGIGACTPRVDGESAPACDVVGPSACPDPLLAYDPSVADLGILDAGDEDIGTVIAAHLAPFAEPTTCQAMVVGVFPASESCALPTSLDVAVWGEDTDEPGPIPAMYTVDVYPSMMTAIGTEGHMLVTVPLTSSHECGQWPFVAVRVTSAQACFAVAPASCDATNAFLLRGGASAWEAGLLPRHPTQAYLGLAGCVAD